MSPVRWGLARGARHRPWLQAAAQVGLPSVLPGSVLVPMDTLPGPAVDLGIRVPFCPTGVWPSS